MTDGADDEKWLFPVAEGIISSPFGERTSPISGDYEVHNGVDIAVAEGTEVRAITDGKAVAVGNSPSYGLYIKQSAGDITIIYAHLSKQLIAENSTVNKGDVIALSGHTGMATGPHLHITAEKDGEAFDPMTLF